MQEPSQPNRYRTHPSQAVLSGIQVPEQLPYQEYLPTRVPSAYKKPDEESLNESQLDLASDDDLRGRPWLRFLRMLSELIFIVGLMLLPAILLATLLDFRRYNLARIKWDGPDTMERNQPMEFIRWSIWLAQGYGAYVLLDWLISVFPWLMVKIKGSVLGMPVSSKTMHRLSSLQKARPYLVALVYLILQYQIAGVLLFQSNLYKISLLELKAQTFGALAGVAYNTALLNELKSLKAQSNIVQTLEEALICLFFISIAWALDKWLMDIISVSFYRLSLDQRIRISNSCFKIIDTLYRHLVPFSIVPSEDPTSAKDNFIKLPPSHEETLAISRKRVVRNSSFDRARIVGKTIFDGLCPVDRNYLQPNDLRPYFPQPDQTFAIFDSSKTGRLTWSELQEAIEDIYMERDNLASSLIGSAKLFERLEYVIFSFFMVLALLISFWFFNREGYVWITGLLAPMLAFAFMFKESGSKLFSCMMFVFASHPFDIGDLIIFEGAAHVVAEIELYTSTFIRKDGGTIYVANHVICAKSIFNYSRSLRSKQILEIVFKSKEAAMSTTSGMFEEVRKKFQRQLECNYRDFTGECAISLKESDTDIQIIWIEPSFRTDEVYKGKKSLEKRRKDLVMMVRKILTEHKIEASVHSV